MVVHTHETQSDLQVIPGVYFTTDRNKIEWLLQHNDGDIKFFVGYSGWGKDQLEGEMETGSWLTAAAETRHVFDGAGEEQWSKLMAEVTLGRWISPDHMPEDPSMN
jgi:putative transcriptional regulator